VSVSRLGKRLTKTAGEVLEDLPAKPKVDPDLPPAPKRTPKAGAALRARHPQPAKLLREEYPHWRAAAESALILAGVPLNRPMLRELTRTARTWLGDRKISKLVAAAQEELNALLRDRLLHLSPTVDSALLAGARRRGQLLLKTRDLPSVELLTTPVEGGTWIQVIPTDRPNDVLAEAFAPLTAGGKAPTSRPEIPDFRKQTWIDDAGRRLRKPPPLPDRPPRVSSGLLPGALDKVPETLQRILRQAELRRLGFSTETLSGAPIAGLQSVPEHLRAALGGGIRAVQYRVVDSRIKLVLRGRTRIPIVRLGDEKVLPKTSEVFGPGTTMERLHPFGSIFGDSIAAGIAYGPRQLNQAMLEMENIMRVRGLAENPSMDIVVDALIEMRKVNGVDHPHLLRATYSWTDGGTPYTFSVGLEGPRGAERVYGPVPGFGEALEEGDVPEGGMPRASRPGRVARVSKAP
jgi:hypothetical protein